MCRFHLWKKYKYNLAHWWKIFANLYSLYHSWVLTMKKKIRNYENIIFLINEDDSLILCLRGFHLCKKYIHNLSHWWKIFANLYSLYHFLGSNYEKTAAKELAVSFLTNFIWTPIIWNFDIQYVIFNFKISLIVRKREIYFNSNNFQNTQYF